jgi:deoxyribodipyrimidine photo-lyase
LADELVSAPVTVVWFRTDLRVADNPALTAAAERGPVVPIYVWAPEEEGDWPPGAASRWWLHHSLAALGSELKRLGAPLIRRRGDSLEEVLQVAKEAGASAVYWNRSYEPASLARERRVEAALRGTGLETIAFNASLLREPWTVAKQNGKPYQVFTAYWRACQGAEDPGSPVSAPRWLRSATRPIASLEIESFRLLPAHNWADGFGAVWKPGERGAAAELERFLQSGLEAYADNRNRPDLEGTSRLSPHLHFGEVGPRQVWRSVMEKVRKQTTTGLATGPRQFLAELGWREFAHHLLFHSPHTPEQPLRAEFAAFPWRDNPEWREAWEQGRTGYPLVDAGMRQLWKTGWMHNRVRMVVASFLVKNLSIPWQQGARWFWDTLVDADLANNTLGWQWTAGCGADAAPFFRIFNPVTQGEKVDPDGVYVRQWVPELAKLPSKWVHKPWQAPGPVLAEGGVALGKEYPEPLVSLFSSRQAALSAYDRIKRGLNKRQQREQR